MELAQIKYDLYHYFCLENGVLFVVEYAQHLLHLENILFPLVQHMRSPSL